MSPPRPEKDIKCHHQDQKKHFSYYNISDWSITTWIEKKIFVLPTGYVTVVPTAVKADDKTSPTFLAITCGSLIPCTSGKQYRINYSFWCQYEEELLPNNT